MIQLSGIVASPPDPRDYLYKPLLGPYRDDLDMRPEAADIEDQGAWNSCTANAAVSAAELIETRAKGKVVHRSRRFNYYLSRERDGLLPADDGAVLRTAIHAAHLYGLPPEDLCPYDKSAINTRPSDAVYAAATTAKISRYERIDLAWKDNRERTQLIWSALSEGCPVAFAARVGAHLRTLSGPLADQRYGMVGVAGNDPIGNHAMLFVGKMPGQYSSFIAENSWPAWGDRGFMAYGQISMQDLIEAWVIRGFAGIDPTTAAKHAWALANPFIVRDWVYTHTATPQAIIDGAIEYGLSAADLEAIVPWAPGAIRQYADSAQGARLDWRGFAW